MGVPGPAVSASPENLLEFDPGTALDQLNQKLRLGSVSALWFGKPRWFSCLHWSTLLPHTSRISPWKSKASVGWRVEQNLSKSVPRVVSRHCTKKVSVVSMCEKHGFLYWRTLIHWWLFCSFWRYWCLRFPTVSDHKASFWETNNRTNLCETLHSIEAHGEDTNDWIGIFTMMNFNQSIKQFLLVSTLCFFLWQKLWTILEMKRDQYLLNTYSMAGRVQGPTNLKGLIPLVSSSRWENWGIERWNCLSYRW